MRLRSLWSIPVILAVMLLSLPAPASADTRVYVRVGPPPPVVQVRTVRPGPRHVWAPGYHRWNGRAYRWVPGRWVVAPRRHAVWVPPHWQRDRYGWFFVAGRWR